MAECNCCCNCKSIADSITDYKTYIKTKGVSDEVLDAIMVEGVSLSKAVAIHYSEDSENALAFKTNIETLVSKLEVNLDNDDEASIFVNQIRVAFNLPYFTCLTLVKRNAPEPTKEFIFGRCYEEAKANLVLKLQEEDTPVEEEPIEEEEEE